MVDASPAIDVPTRPRPVDAHGRELDEWGLPLIGPARIDVLDGRTDPAVDPTGWTRADEQPSAPASPPPPASPPATADAASQES